MLADDGGRPSASASAAPRTVSVCQTAPAPGVMELDVPRGDLVAENL